MFLCVSAVFSLRSITLSFLLVNFSIRQVFVRWQLFQINSVAVEFVILLDYISISILLTVVIISLSVFTFSAGYMSKEKFFFRFHWILLLFVVSIFFLIISPNLLRVILGWDGLGVTSYLLVIFYRRRKSYNAGMLTALTNRFGDVLLLIRVGLILREGRWRMLWYRPSLKIRRSLSLVLLIVASFTKRAQIPFSAWLPAAMAAPTPVSALVHSSTLVTAGVYLIVRHSLLLENLTQLSIVLFFGLITITMASVSALNEKDIKKIIALSTLRQLGIMIVSIGMAWRYIAFLHLIIHAFFKAIIFVSTGNFIHLRNNYQRVLKTGGLLFISPINSSSAFVSTIRLAAAPFSAAYFSKEPILEGLLWISRSTLFFLFFFLGVILTIAYRMRFVCLVLLRVLKQASSVVVYEYDVISSVRILILFVPSFTRGICVSSLFLSKGMNYLVYANSIKLFISIFCLVIRSLILLGMQAKLVYFFNRFDFSIFFLWSLPIFRATLFTQRCVARSLSPYQVTWRYFESMGEGSPVFFFERKDFIRIFIVIPVRILVCGLLRICWE